MWAIRTNRIIDGLGEELVGDVGVLIDDGRIVDSGAWDTLATEGLERIEEYSDATVLPGLMDTHIHISFLNGVTFDNYRAQLFETSPTLQTLYALFHAQICLEMGMTTLRDVGGFTTTGPNVSEMVALRDAINRGIVVGPKLLISAFTHITSSHFDLLLPRQALHSPDSTADGPWELRKLARRHLRIGCDWVKTCASGGGGTDLEDPGVRNMTQEELDALVDEAHAFRKPLACHCFTPESQKMALRAGADTLEHSVWTDDEAIEMMLERGVSLIPTLARRTDRAIELRRALHGHDSVLEKMKRLQPHTYTTFQRLHAAGVPIVAGTDINYDPHMGSSMLELQVYVDLGMSPMDALMTATSNAAKALKLEHEIGSIAAGLRADVVVVQGNPLENIALLQKPDNIRTVVRGGRDRGRPSARPGT